MNYFDRKGNVFRLIDADVEKFLKYCPCGGEFKHNAFPRCPHCKTILEEFRTPYYETVTVMIEGKKVEDWLREDWGALFPNESLSSKIKNIFSRKDKNYPASRDE